MNNKLLLIIFGLGIWLMPLSVQAVGVAVRPERIDILGKLFQKSEAQILVTNVAAEPANYQITADSCPKAFEIKPAAFLLEANASRLVTVKIERKLPLTLATNLSVVARPLGVSGLTAASGIKIPVIVHFSWWLLALAILGIIAVCFLLFFGVKLIISKISFKRDKPASAKASAGKQDKL